MFRDGVPAAVPANREVLSAGGAEATGEVPRHVQQHARLDPRHRPHQAQRPRVPRSRVRTSPGVSFDVKDSSLRWGSEPQE